MENSKSSFGLELELLIAVAGAGQTLNVPNRFENSTGAPIILPPGVPRGGIAARAIISQRCERTLANAVAKRRGTRVVQSEQEAMSDPESLHLREYTEWTFGSDSSVILPRDQAQEQYIDEYRWYPAEIASPALWATAESFEEIREVVQAFKDEYWIITPPSAGMHYHYGNGKEYIPFQKLRRMAALLVACDPLIVQLHPQHRRVNEYCMSNRLYSRIAHGRPAAVASREINAEYIEAEPEFPTNRPKTKPVARPSRMRTPNFLVPFQRGTLTGYDLTDEFFYLAFTESGYDYDNIVENPRPLEIPYAVREILRCTNAPTVAELMRHTPLDAQRPAYSFKAYSHGEYKHTIMQDGQNVLEYQYKRTVEFRQMASTMDPNCVVAHGKIVVRLCEIAASMELEELYQVALDCAVGETNGDWFDVFDLLAEFGLESEAKVLQYPVAEFRGEIIPEEVVNDQAQAEGAEERTGQWLSWLGWLS